MLVLAAIRSGSHDRSRPSHRCASSPCGSCRGYRAPQVPRRALLRTARRAGRTQRSGRTSSDIELHASGAFGSLLSNSQSANREFGRGIVERFMSTHESHQADTVAVRRCLTDRDRSRRHRRCSVGTNIVGARSTTLEATGLLTRLRNVWRPSNVHYHHRLGNSFYHRFPLESFRADPVVFRIEIADNRFYIEGVSLSASVAHIPARRARQAGRRLIRR